MKVNILNLYSNESMPGSELRGAHGQSFLITMMGQKIMMDVGDKSSVLMHNMNILGISPDDIDTLILSHGHYDHTKALPDFIDQRSSEVPLPVIAHPNVREQKRAKMGPVKKDIGFPRLTEAQERRLEFRLSREPQKLNEYLITTGEILNRPERDGSEPTAQRLSN
ncbi:MAG: MBL fold metallo-hydrolase, partial [Candidatus Thorarchaeota archaeon]